MKNPSIIMACMALAACSGLSPLAPINQPPCDLSGSYDLVISFASETCEENCGEGCSETYTDTGEIRTTLSLSRHGNGASYDATLSMFYCLTKVPGFYDTCFEHIFPLPAKRLNLSNCNGKFELYYNENTADGMYEMLFNGQLGEGGVFYFQQIDGTACIHTETFNGIWRRTAS